MGFSSDVDAMLMDAVKVGTCAERERCVILMMDEMHIKGDLVFDHYSGRFIGYTNLGNVTDKLSEFERFVEERHGQTSPPLPLAKSMMVFMVRSLFTKLQFPYAQFPVVSVSGDQLYEPFWEAIGRLENCGLKVRCFILTSASMKILPSYILSSCCYHGWCIL